MFSFMERCQRGRMGRPAKALSGINRTVGSNPTLSAIPQALVVLVILVLIFGVSSLSTPRASAAACRSGYRVQQGDSWWSIAQTHTVSLADLLRRNKANQSTFIKQGDLLCIPIKSPSLARVPTQNIIQIIRDVWPDDIEEKAIAIAKRESHLRPRAVSRSNGCCYGLFQIYFRWHRQWLSKFGITRAEQLLDPRTNATAAFELYKRNGGWGPWTP